MKRIFLLLALCLAAASQVNAQADSVTLITDRPTQSASAYTIAKGTWQIETGFTYTNFIGPTFPGLPEVRLENTTFNTTHVRLGITDKLELNFVQSLTSIKLFFNDVQQGETLTELLPTSLGLRFQLAEEKGLIPQISVLANVVGAPFVSGTNDYLLDLRFNMQHNLNDGWSLGYNLGATDIASNFTPLYTIVLGKSLDAKLAAFVEAFGTFNEGAANTHNLDYGFTYLLNNDMQLDVYAGNALNEFSTDFIFGLGFSARIPGK